jgi:hypothetical protein
VHLTISTGFIEVYNRQADQGRRFFVYPLMHYNPICPSVIIVMEVERGGACSTHGKHEKYKQKFS